MEGVSNDQPRLRPGESVTVQLRHAEQPKLTYEMTVVADDGDRILVEGPFAGSVDRDLGFVRLQVGDWFVEQYWRSRWYSIKEIRGENGRKGWYCDITRPALVRDGQLVSDDLDLDVWISSDFSMVLVLDEDEFLASDIEATDPAAARRAREAVAALLTAATERSPLFS